jgi:acyl-CoA synthetase (AMP-forming)/AMP-acid ligase II/acetyltransferase-like isoleucine patch superfamily enzyme/acyl carrier protein
MTPHLRPAMRSGLEVQTRDAELIPLAPLLQRWSLAWKGAHRLLGADVAADLQFDSLLDLLPCSGAPGVSGVDGRESLSFAELRHFLEAEFSLHQFGLGRGDRCALALPDGPELAVCLLGTTMRCAAAPLNPFLTEEEIRRELVAVRAKAVIVQAESGFEHVVHAARDLGISVIQLSPHPRRVGLFHLTGPTDMRAVTSLCVPTDTVLVLQTSGTSGQKKVVPIRLRDLCVGAACIAAALELGPRDCGYGMMPLFHVGGITRNLFAPVLAGSPMIFATGVDANMFWDALEHGAGVTWYYGSPTVHEAVLQGATHRSRAAARLRFVANAAGALLPSTAARLQQCFGAAILASYGMTECIPIASLPLDGLDRPGSSGRVLGPNVSIRNAAGEELPCGSQGYIMIRGAPLMQGYEECQPDDASLVDGWFNTGDLGWLDEDRYVYVIGRAKEVIKHGGETISPLEVEEALVGHPEIRAALVFAVPHRTLQEAIAAIIVPRGSRRPDLSSIHAYLSTRLHPGKWPVLLVYMDDLPRSATNKLQRIGMAQRLGLTEVDETLPQLCRLYEAKCRGPDAALRSVAVDHEAIATAQQCDVRMPCDEIEQYLHGELCALLGLAGAVSVDKDFFELGGTSLSAVQLIARIRDRFSVHLPSTAMFRTRTISALATMVRQAVASPQRPVHDDGPRQAPGARPEDAIGADQVRPRTLVTQALPLALFPPLLRIGQFVCLIVIWWWLISYAHLSRFPALLLAIGATILAKGSMAPLLAIVFKWAVIGRYKDGRYPLWKGYYLRWWLTRQAVKAAGLGVFGGCYSLTALYYRMLGARVGRGARIEPSADLGEFDLLKIGEGVCIDAAVVVRPFAVDAGAMVLREIEIGPRSTLGLRSTVVPGAVLPADAELPPMASSSDATPWQGGTRQLCHPFGPLPSVWLRAVAALIRLAVALGSCVGTLVVLHFTLRGVGRSTAIMTFHGLFASLAVTSRIGWYVMLRVADAVLSPFLYLGFVILVKRTIIGRFRAGPYEGRTWPEFQRWLMRQLLPDGTFGGVAKLIGANFAGISTIYRLLGARIGERIYWPGSGHYIIDYDLFSCGDDVTFGSRSALLVSDASGAEPICIEAGATVADRCVLSPGTRVGRNAVVGSGTFVPPGWVVPAGSTYIGCDRGGPIELEAESRRRTDEPTIRPFGLATDEGTAAYRVWPLWLRVVFNCLCAGLSSVYRAVPLIVALVWATSVVGQPEGGLASVAVFSVTLFGAYVVVDLGAAIGALLICIAAKWLIVGRRTVGKHLWNQSSYCQRWKLCLDIEMIQHQWMGSENVLSCLHGTAYIVWYFRAMGARIGAGVCLYPNGADPLMEEPDLVHIEDGVSVDQAILISHLNTRGEWELGQLEIGKRASLRTRSRVMIQATVGDDAVVRECALVLGGDVVPAGAAWEGWPGDRVRTHLG